MSKGLDPAAELLRLRSGACADPAPPGFTRFEVDVDAPGAADAVLARTKEVLARIVAVAGEGWPEDEEWPTRLPAWFVQASAADDAPSPADDDGPWPVSAFVYWFRLEVREWWWWGADVIDRDRLRICLAVNEPSFPHEALDWLLRAAGATTVVDENVRDLMRRGGDSRAHP